MDPNSGGWTNDPYFSNPSNGEMPDNTAIQSPAVPDPRWNNPAPDSRGWGSWNNRQRPTWNGISIPRSTEDIIHTPPVRMPQPPEDPRWKAITGGKPPVRMPQHPMSTPPGMVRVPTYDENGNSLMIDRMIPVEEYDDYMQQQDKKLGLPDMKSINSQGNSATWDPEKVKQWMKSHNWDRMDL